MEHVLMASELYAGRAVVTVALTDGRTRDRFQCAYSVN